MKRLGVSDSTEDTNSFSKKHMVGPQIDFPWAAASQPKTMGTPSLDMQRAASSRQHVRALNNQFASWVQSQLKNHPDELWEDGVRDYLTHASNILEKFSDVVNWLNSNSTKSENLSESGLQAAQKKLVTEDKDITNVPSQAKTSNAPLSGPASMFATSGFASTWSPRPLSNSQSTQSSFSFGIQSSVGVTPDASKDAEGDDEAEQPSSPSVKKTKEAGISVVHEVKCTIYMKVIIEKGSNDSFWQMRINSTDPTDKDAWKDRGTGQLSIKCKEGVAKGTKDSKPTILVRNDVGRIVLNALLYPGIKTNLQKNSIVAIFHTADDNGSDNSKVVARTFLIRLKSEEDRDKLAAAIKEYAPAT